MKIYHKKMHALEIVLYICFVKDVLGLERVLIRLLHVSSILYFSEDFVTIL